MMVKYTHTEDNIDRVCGALGRLKETEGMEAVWAVLPAGTEAKVKKLREIENIGIVRAVEIVLRLEDKQWMF